MENLLDFHGEMLMEQYRERLPQLRELEEVVSQILSERLRGQGISLSGLEHRVKTERSLRGKLELKGQKYKDINDITDLVGVRVVTFFTDDVDRVAAFVKEFFEVDWKNSLDKRKGHELTSFGYNSLHYVCHLREGKLAEIPFEVQMRTTLQHVWAAINHDIGYKPSVRLPQDFQRQFSRLAAILELADDEFSRLRTTLNGYKREMERLLAEGELGEVPLNNDTFRDYLSTRPFDRLNRRIAAVNQAEIYPVSLLPFCRVLEDFGLETLGDLDTFVQANEEDAYQLALTQLAVTDLDIFSEYVGVQNICLVHILKNGGSRPALRAFFDAIYGNQEGNDLLADQIIDLIPKLPFLQQPSTH